MTKRGDAPSGIRWQQLRVSDRRAAIRRGWDDYAFHAWAKDPPYPNDDPRHWLWMNGAEQAERSRLDGSRIEQTEGWHATD